MRKLWRKSSHTRSDTNDADDARDSSCRWRLCQLRSQCVVRGVLSPDGFAASQPSSGSSRRGWSATCDRSRSRWRANPEDSLGATTTVIAKVDSTRKSRHTGNLAGVFSFALTIGVITATTHCVLGFGHSLDLGIWILGFGSWAFAVSLSDRVLHDLIISFD